MPKPPCQPEALSQLRPSLRPPKVVSMRSSLPSALRARMVSVSLRMALPETPIDRPICGMLKAIAPEMYIERILPSIVYQRWTPSCAPG
jgi:hypothetical protein